MKNLSTGSMVLMILSGLCIISSVFLPVWRIELDAPQYPEGLALSIYANKLAGDVDVINGLNHYIGMKTLHSEDFWEFIYLPYILICFGVIAIIIGIFRKKEIVKFLLGFFLLFGVLAMYDFWKWEYAYGHDLDPTAAIQVPGMAYQPPLIGFKQLLNFGAYSMPDIGGWLMLLGGLLMAFVYVKDNNLLSFIFKKRVPLIFVFSWVVLNSGCSPNGPEPIILHKDMCSHCKMAISDGHFGGEVITDKGRVYKFDDLYCLREFLAEKKDIKINKNFIHDYLHENQLIPAETAYFVKSGLFKSPMGGNTAGFSKKEDAEKISSEKNGEVFTWSEIINQ